MADYKTRWNTGESDGDLQAKVSVALQIIAKEAVDASGDWSSENAEKRALVAAALSSIDTLGPQVTRIIASNSDLTGASTDAQIKGAIDANLTVLAAAYQA